LNAHKHLLLLPGEYPYHEQVFRKLNKSFSFWNFEKPDKDSYLILSLPFSGDGNVLKNYEEIIYLCEKWNIDILLDLSFFALSNKKIKIKKSARIKAITFSLSKIFDVGNYRLGMTYWSHPNTPESVLRQWTYENHFSSYLAVHLLKTFSMENLRNEAENIQKSICHQFDLTPSESYLFGLSRSEQWSTYFRQEGLARICISRLIQRQLATKVENK
jgi:hypothetical protein